MEADYRYLWAKKKEKGGVYLWLPLYIHLADTMGVIGWLWNHWLSEGQRSSIIGQIQPADEGTAENLVRFLGGIHDIGKATPAFQTQKGFSSSTGIDGLLLENLEKAGYRGISTLKLQSPEKTRHPLAGEVILSKYGFKDDIASIVGAHHGKPVDIRPDYHEQISAYTANYYQSEDNNSKTGQLWENIWKTILNNVLLAAGFQGLNSQAIEVFPKLSKQSQVILSGLLIMADWIASNEKFFPLIPTDSVKIDNEETRVINGLKSWVKTLPIDVEAVSDASVYYNNRFGFEPRTFQKVLFDIVKTIKEPGIVIIEAPTGSGKTEAALSAAEQLFAVSNRSGVFFGLPTQATSNGIFPRVESWLDRFLKDYDEKASIRLSHGHASLNDDFNEIKLKHSNAALNDGTNSASENISADEHESSIIVNEWFSGRKTAALDDYVVGTVDNFLLLALKQKHLALRHLGFHKKVVIIDEVHAYDVYMQEYLKKAVRWMGAYRVPVILLSATLPSDIRRSLIEQYMIGRGADKKSLNIPDMNAYPMLTYSDDNEVKVNTDLPKDRDKDVYIKDLDEEDLLSKTDDLIKYGGIVGIIVNTVKRAQNICRLCTGRYGNDVVELLHANFIATERVAKEKSLISMIGKGADRPFRKIIIGTQVMEQSLDIDFDVLITDLCPMDLFIQRIGRMHRHDIERSPEHMKPVVYIMGKSYNLEFEKGSSYIYSNYILARTQYFLPDILKVPSDVSQLVQKVYGKDEPAFEGELLKKYNDRKQKIEDQLKNKEAKAETFCIDIPKKNINPEKNNLIGWLRDPDSSESDEKASARVRDINDSVEIIAVFKYKKGYTVYKEKGKNTLSDNLELNAKRIAQETLRLPNSVTYKCGGLDNIIKILEDYNRNKLPEWQTDPWLKGSLGLIFDESNEVDINGIILQYDNIYGLKIKGDENI
ncbi:MAG: CRISPR-associated helicase Cas3' [Lachnospiraceae bacterium]|nr:CRISPR-associated helicase Cas3' [Lachnospiraceae bacterium]